MTKTTTAQPSSKVTTKITAAPEAGKPAINVNAAVVAANLVKETLAALTARRAELVDARCGLQEQIAKLWDAPVTRDEAKELLLSSVNALAAEFPATVKWHELFAAFVKPTGQRQTYAMKIAGGGSGRSDTPLSLADLEVIRRNGVRRGLGMVLDIETLGLVGNPDAATIEKALCFFLGDKVKQVIESQFNALMPERAFPRTPGLTKTAAERHAEIETLDERVAAIDGDLANVEAQIADLAPPKSGR
jgi:hypothetical protein